jgi:serine phosphatase RsbU (regulator of sigma subunit)
VTERHAPNDDMYDLPRLTSSFEQSAAQTPDEQVQSIVRDLDAFGADREPDDDQTLLLMVMEGVK